MNRKSALLPADLFQAIWETLVSVLGTATVAALMRRGARHTAAARSDLTGLTGFEIRREGLEYKYLLPPSWKTEEPEAYDALRYLVSEELVPLLRELTGPVVIRRLEQVPELRERGILREENSAS